MFVENDAEFAEASRRGARTAAVDRTAAGGGKTDGEELPSDAYDVLVGALGSDHAVETAQKMADESRRRRARDKKERDRRARLSAPMIYFGNKYAEKP